MDPKTKALLHTSGATLASTSKTHMVTDFTVFPPAATFSVTDQMLTSFPSGDKKVLIAGLAKQIGQNVAKLVEEQILKAYAMDAKSALGLIMEAKKTFHAEGAFHPVGFSDPFKFEGFATPQEEYQPPTYDSVLSDIKTAMKLVEKSKHGGILSLDNPDELWNLPPGSPVFFLGGPAGGHIEHIWKDEIAKQYKDLVTSVSVDHGTSKAKVNSVTQVFHDLIPGFAEMRQPCPHGPCPWSKESPLLQSTIIHLNDTHKWTREAIAEWLETLDHDLTFKTPEEVQEAPVGGMEEHIMQLMVKGLDTPLDPSIFGLTETGEGVKNGDDAG